MFETEFDKAELEQGLPTYKYIKTLGAGAFAKVFLVQNRQTNEQIALKKVSCFGMGDYQKNGSVNQVRILSSLSHPSIIKVTDCLYDSNEQILYIMMEYAESGDLSTLIAQAKEKKKRIPQSTIWKIILDVADGLMYLNQNQILHRDLKPANIFRMDKSFKIGDMNVSKILKPGEVASTKTGSPLYTAPQVWEQDGQYGFQCDIWSLGVVVYELCSLALPFEAESIFQLVNKIKNFKGEKNLPTFYSVGLNELVKKMIEFDPKKRIPVQEIVKIGMQKLKIEMEGLDEKGIDNLMKTIVFPQCPESNQRWVQLIPSFPSLPPKTSRIQSSVSEKADKCEKMQKKKRSISRERSDRSQNRQFKENNSGIFKSTEKKPIILPKSQSRSKIQKASEIKPQILPPLCKNSPQIPKKQTLRPDISSREKRNEQSSRKKRKNPNQSHSQRKSSIEQIKQTKTFILHEKQ